MSMENVDWNERYKDQNIPWDEGVPAEALVRELPNLPLTGKAVLEIGCGTGTNAIWLAKNGYTVVATDISELAIREARTKSAAAGIAVEFMVQDIVDALPVPEHSQSFVFDRGVFHVMSVAGRSQFAQRVAKALSQNGIWLSISGSADDRLPADTPGPPRLTATEILVATEPFLELLELRRDRICMPDKSERAAWCAIFRRRG